MAHLSSSMNQDGEITYYVEGEEVTQQQFNDAAALQAAENAEAQQALIAALELEAQQRQVLADSGKTKLLALGLTAEEVLALFGI